MTWIVAAFGLLTAALGFFGLVRPAGLIGFVESFWTTSRGLVYAVALRVVLGVALLAAAPDCRFPQAIRILGGMSLAAAAAGLVMGFSRVKAFVGWWSARPPGLIRGWCLVAVAFGAFLVYAAI